jgi:predicted component of type VI protein secretion system
VESPATPDEVIGVLDKNIRLGELSEMNDLKRFNVLGLERNYMKNPPQELPSRDDLHYFKLERKGHHWDSIRQKKNLTMGYLGESEELVVTSLKAKGSAQNLFKLYVALNPEQAGG